MYKISNIYYVILCIYCLWITVKTYTYTHFIRKTNNF